MASEAERGHHVVVEGLKSIYRNIVRPIEAVTKFENFHSNMVRMDQSRLSLTLGRENCLQDTGWYTTSEIEFYFYALLRRR